MKTPSFSFLQLQFFNIFLYLQVDDEDFKEEQNSVARLLQMLHSDDPDEMLLVSGLLRFSCMLPALYVPRFLAFYITLLHLWIFYS